jgi:hypothetical protein
MKSVIRTALLGGLAMLALSLAATGVAAAATTPEFKPVPTKKKFTSTSGKSIWTLSKETIQCANSTMSGEITSATTLGNVIVKYTGCSLKTAEGTECPVKSEAGGKEEIVINKLKGELGTIVPKEIGSGVGLLLQPAVEKGDWTVVKGEGCGGIFGAVYGTLAGKVEELGKQTGHKITYSYAGIKEMTMDSGSVVKPSMESDGAQMTVEQADSLKFEEALEIT